MAKQIKIKWCAFGDKPEIWRFSSSVEFELGSAVGQNINEIADENICEWLQRYQHIRRNDMEHHRAKDVSNKNTHSNFSRR